MKKVFLVLPICLALSTLTACKTGTKQAETAGPTLTQFAGHNTPAFTEATAYARLLRTQVEIAFIEGGNQPFTAACNDARVNIEMRPGVAIESCRVGMDAEDSSQVAIKYSNGWAIVSDSQGTRQVDAAQLPSLQ